MTLRTRPTPSPASPSTSTPSGPGGGPPRRLHAHDRGHHVRRGHLRRGRHLPERARGPPETAHRELARTLTAHPHTEPSGLGDHPDFLHFKNWLIAAAPDGLLEATTGLRTGIGVGYPGDGEPAVAYVTEDLLVSDGDASKAARTLRDLVDQWYAQGAPQTSSLRATLTRCDTGWQLHVGV